MAVKYTPTLPFYLEVLTMKSKAEQEELRAKLDEMTAAIEAAVAARKEWMDSHMEDFAIVKPGEVLYKREGDNFIRLGVVSKLYRYWGDQKDWRFDKEMSISYQYQPYPGSYHDNTSREGWMALASEADKERWERRTLEQLASKYKAG